MVNSSHLERVAALHRRAVIIDGHNDILVPLTDGMARLGERFELPDPATWLPPLGATLPLVAEYGFSPHSSYFGPLGQYDLPRLREGGVTASVFAISMDQTQLNWALQRGLQMVWALHREVAAHEDFELITSAAQIRRLKAQGRCGAILGLEGLEALASDLRMLDIYYSLGVRVAGLTHGRRNLFGDGAQAGIATGGLTRHGREAVKRCNERGIVIDLAHISERGFWEILELTTSPVVLSHTTSTMFKATHKEASGRYRSRPGLDLPRDREVLNAIVRNDGVVGIIFFAQETLDDIVRDVEIALDAMGPHHVGLGSDLYGLDMAPKELSDISRIPAITEALCARGYTDEVILGVLGENFLRVFERVWK